LVKEESAIVLPGSRGPGLSACDYFSFSSLPCNFSATPAALKGGRGIVAAFIFLAAQC
jgi:hypothetical protein